MMRGIDGGFTGAIKAIANLSRNKDGDYVENFNYAIAEASEPGSTFKLASLMAVSEDGLVDLNDSINVGNGTSVYFGKKMEDASTEISKAFFVQAGVWKFFPTLDLRYLSALPEESWSFHFKTEVFRTSVQTRP